MEQDASSTTGAITYTNENGATSTANVVSADDDNNIEVGSDGGAYFAGPIIYAAGRHEADELNDTTPKTVYKATITRESQGIFFIEFDEDIGTTNYIIQITPEDCGGNCPDNGNTSYDDPTIGYYDVDTDGFRVRAGDNDNGANSLDLADLGFMFTVIKLP